VRGDKREMGRCLWVEESERGIEGRGRKMGARFGVTVSRYSFLARKSILN